MKRSLPDSDEDELPGKRQNTTAVNPFADPKSLIKINTTKVIVPNHPDLPQIPHEVIFNHIVPYYSLTWLFVSKKSYKIAFSALPADPRLEPKFSNAEHIFFKACKEGNFPVVQLLLKDPRVVPITFQVSLSTISLDYNIAKLFIECNKTFIIERIFYWAIKQGHLDMIVQLLSSSNSGSISIIELNRQHFILSAITVSKHAHILKYLLTQVNAELFSSVYISSTMINTISSGNCAVFEELIKHVDPSWHHNFALRYASLYGQYEIVNLLLQQHQVDPNDRRECEFDDPANGANPYLLSAMDHANASSYLLSAIEEALKHRQSAVITLLMNDPRVLIDSTIRDRYDYVLP